MLISMRVLTAPQAMNILKFPVEEATLQSAVRRNDAMHRVHHSDCIVTVSVNYARRKFPV